MRINLNLLLELSKRDFLERYSGSIIGIWWSFIWPFINILIYTLIFSKVMSAKISEIPSTYSYGIYLASGIIPWMAFSNTISRSVNIFIEKKYIISKIPIQLPIFPLSVAISESITFLISFFILILFLIILSIKPTICFFVVPLSYIFQQILALSLGLIFATLNVFIRDIKEVVNTPLIVRRKILKHNEAVSVLENTHQIEFTKHIPISGSLSVIKSFIREGIGNAVLPYYAVYEEINNGEFKIIEKIDSVSDGYQIAITKDKRSLLEIIKFINFTKNFKII